MSGSCGRRGAGCLDDSDIVRAQSLEGPSAIIIPPSPRGSPPCPHAARRTSSAAGYSRPSIRRTRSVQTSFGFSQTHSFIFAAVSPAPRRPPPPPGLRQVDERAIRNLQPRELIRKRKAKTKTPGCPGTRRQGRPLSRRLVLVHNEPRPLVQLVERNDFRTQGVGSEQLE